MHLGQPQGLTFKFKIKLLINSMEKSGGLSDVSLFVRLREGLFHMPASEKNVAAGNLKRFDEDCVESDVSPCGSFVIGCSSKGKVTVWDVEGNKLIEEVFADVANVSFSKKSRFAVVTHGASKDTKIKVYRLGTKEASVADSDIRYRDWLHEERQALRLLFRRRGSYGRPESSELAAGLRCEGWVQSDRYYGDCTI